MNSEYVDLGILKEYLSLQTLNPEEITNTMNKYITGDIETKKLVINEMRDALEKASSRLSKR